MWMCHACRGDFAINWPKYPYGLCKSCYYTPHIVAAYRAERDASVNYEVQPVPQADVGMIGVVGHDGPVGVQGNDWGCYAESDDQIPMALPADPDTNAGDPDILMVEEIPPYDPSILFVDKDLNPHSDLSFYTRDGMIRPNPDTIGAALACMGSDDLVDTLLKAAFANPDGLRKAMRTVLKWDSQPVLPACFTGDLYAGNDPDIGDYRPVSGPMDPDQYEKAYVPVDNPPPVWRDDKRTYPSNPADAELNYMFNNRGGTIEAMDHAIKLAMEQKAKYEAMPPSKVAVSSAEAEQSEEIKRQMAKLQFIMGGQISVTDKLKSVGTHYQDEIRRMMEEQKFQAEQQAKLQREMLDKEGGYGIAVPARKPDISPIVVDIFSHDPPLDHEQLFFDRIKQIVGDNSVHFETGPGFDMADFHDRVRDKFSVGYPLHQDMTKDELAALYRRYFADAWFGVRNEFYNEGKITKDYTDYSYRRILPPLQPGEIRTIDLSQGTTHKIDREKLWGRSPVENNFKKRPDKATEERFAKAIDDELDRGIPHPPFAWRSGASGMVTVDTACVCQSDLKKMTPREWDKLSQTLPVISVPAYRPKYPGETVRVASDLVKRSKKEMDEEIRWLNEAAGYPVE
jgi:hypothetical protein